jgi:hypothetical protein
MYLAATVQQYVFDRRRDAKDFLELTKALSDSKGVIVMPSSSEVTDLTKAIHESSENGKDQAAKNGKP